ncbi:hypothetical protein DFJ63DRAFT_334745 [Scheffersomyces coipomensis]|uniref:uncharacterized protein n=1 Tax=Scheffersomyces coipomensis TaxID=1788519 RepID=UPI00315DFD9F
MFNSRDPFVTYKRQSEENVKEMKRRRQLNVISGNLKSKQTQTQSRSQNQQPKRRPLQEIKSSNIFETRGLKKRLESGKHKDQNNSVIPTQHYDSTSIYSELIKRQHQVQLSQQVNQSQPNMSLSGIASQIVSNSLSRSIGLDSRRDKFQVVKSELINRRNLHFKYTTLQPSLIEQSNDSIQSFFNHLSMTKYNFITNSDKPSHRQPTHMVKSVFRIGKFVDSTILVNLKTSEESQVLLLLTDNRFNVQVNDKLILNNDLMMKQMVNGKEVKIYKEWKILKSEFKDIDFFN